MRPALRIAGHHSRKRGSSCAATVLNSRNRTMPKVMLWSAILVQSTAFIDDTSTQSIRRVTISLALAAAPVDARAASGPSSGRTLRREGAPRVRHMEDSCE